MTNDNDGDKERGGDEHRIRQSAEFVLTALLTTVEHLAKRADDKGKMRSGDQ